MSTLADKANKSNRKTFNAHDRPSFECIALLLQGGGALGAYQAGDYQALSWRISGSGISRASSDRRGSGLRCGRVR
jgi:hypothetical protein